MWWADSLEKTLMLGKIEGRRRRVEEDDRDWDCWMASPTWWTWVWVSSGSWCWAGKPGMLQSMGSQRVRHNWATELNFPLKAFMVEQNLWNWFLDTSSPSPQVAGLLNKEIFPFWSMLISWALAPKWEVAKPEFDSKSALLCNLNAGLWESVITARIWPNGCVISFPSFTSRLSLPKKKMWNDQCLNIIVWEASSFHLQRNEQEHCR